MRPGFPKPLITTGKRNTGELKSLILNLEDENRRLKQMFADLSLECRALKDVIEKALKPAFKRDCQRRMKSGSSATLVEIFMPVDSCPSA